MFKKALLTFACIAVILPALPRLAAAEESGLYEPTYDSLYGASTVKRPFFAGVGISYDFQMLDLGTLTEEVKPTTLKAKFDNTYGVRLSMGYHFTGILAAEFTADWLNSFDWNGSYYYKGAADNTSMKLDTGMLMLSGRIQPPIGKQTWFSPYFTLGAGVLQGQVDSTVVSYGKPHYYSNYEAHPVGRVGTGADFYLNDKISVGLDASFYFGFNALDEVKFFALTAGTAYHF
jgi:hypothetical protein